MTRRRTYRWGFVVVMLLVGAALGIGVVIGSQAPGQAAESRLARFATQAGALTESLVSIDAEIASGADPDPSTVTRTATLAADLKELAALPDPWPVVVDTGYDLDRVHRAAFEASAAATDLVARSTLLIAYLAEAPRAIELPALPGVLDGPALAELDAALTIALANAGARVAALPESVMGTHRAELVATVAALGDWREPYLEALRNGDSAAADLAHAAIARVDELSGVYDTDRAESLDQLRAKVTEAIRLADAVRLLSR